MNGPQLTGGKQTMMAWARLIRAREEIPFYFQAEFDQLWRENQPFPYMVLTPVISGIRHKPTEKLLIQVDDVLHILEKRGRRIASDAIDLRNNIDLEMGNALLYSWITLREQNDHNLQHAVTITYNAATHRHFVPWIQKIRPASIPVNGEIEEKQLFSAADFKFNHFTNESLLPGEKPLASLWQPAIKEDLIKIFGKQFQRTITLAHMSLLTRQELILFWDDEQSVENRGVRYGGIRRFIPLPAIRNISQQNNNDYGKLKISLKDSSTIERHFAMENKAAAEALVAAYRDARK